MEIIAVDGGVQMALKKKIRRIPNVALIQSEKEYK
jgi:hypothetical protein